MFQLKLISANFLLSMISRNELDNTISSMATQTFGPI